MQENVLTGKVALITGGARRVGAEIARTLHAHGMNIVIHYRSSRDDAHALQTELERHRPNSVVLAKGDLLKVAQLPGVVEEAVAAFGRLDALVNNASTFYPTPVGTAGAGPASVRDAAGSRPPRGSLQPADRERKNSTPAFRGRYGLPAR